MNINIFFSAFLSIAFMASCAGGKYASTEKIYKKNAKQFAKSYEEQPTASQLDRIIYTDKEWIASTNFGVRKPNYVMIHHTAQDSLEQTIKTFHNQRVGVSSHYVIGRDGKIVQMVNDLFRAHHAGAGKWGNDTDLNSSSIGIELDNNGTTDPWPEVQINALLQLLEYLKESYRIPQGNFIGHMDYAPSRKIDPANFPWEKLAKMGFGFWYDEGLEPAPENFDVRMALRIVGFDVKDLSVAIKAFKKHYIHGDDSSVMSDYDQAILYDVMKKYL